MATQLNATILTHSTVTDINCKAQTITLFDANNVSQTLSYDQLILALGATKKQVPLSGTAATSVLSVNSLTDYRKFRAALTGKKHVTILGSGLVGCEFANDLIQNDFSVDVIAPDRYPLQQLVPEPVGLSLQNHLNNAGIHWHFSRFAKDISYSDNQIVTTLDNGDSIQSDLVLSAVGLTPNLSLAKTAGLTTHLGICVDEHFQTSDPHVFAIGDCAEVSGVVRMYVAAILKGIENLSDTLTSKRTPIHYPPMPVIIKTTLHPVVSQPPIKNGDGDWAFEKDEMGIKAQFHNKDGQLCGFALSGKYTSERMTLSKKMTEDQAQ